MGCWAFNAVLLCTCFSSQRLIYAQSAQASQATETIIPGTDILSGRVPCNDPRILEDPVSEDKRLQNSPGVSRKDYNFISCVAYRLTKGNRVNLPPGFASSWAIAIVHKSEINSMMTRLRDGRFAVVAYDLMAQFVNYDPDEEAFILGHEIGHIQDWTSCQNIKAQMSQSLLKTPAMKKAQQICEENADFYGLQYMWGARFNPLAAGAFMGRFQMYAPNQTRGLGSMWENFTSDHPISSERTKKMREEMRELCSKPGTVCQSR